MSHYITSEPIDIEGALKKAHHLKAGAVVLFSGEVRNHHLGKAVEFLEYESHVEMAEKYIDTIIRKAAEMWELHYVFCQHRIGKVDLCESAVLVITSASHREAAYKANMYIIDRLKEEVPIWKKEIFTDGNQVWV